MRFFIKQQVMSLKDRFYVKDEDGRDRYFVDGEFLAFAKKLRIYDEHNNEVVYIEQIKLWNFLPEFDLFMNNEKVATVKKEWAFFRNNHSIIGQDWHIEGSVTAHDYVIKKRTVWLWISIRNGCAGETLTNQSL
ncbi:hypothetical protein IRB23SM22_10750 [Alkalibacterium sp. s-m-22]